VIESSWFRASEAEDFVFTDEDGDVVPIPADAIYWAIVPEGQPVDLG
jgi:hypothetical protein